MFNFYGSTANFDRIIRQTLDGLKTVQEQIENVDSPRSNWQEAPNLVIFLNHLEDFSKWLAGLPQKDGNTFYLWQSLMKRANL